MIPPDPHREVIDPRKLVCEQGRDALAALVAHESGYIFQLRPLKDLCQSLQSDMPLLAEGERGGGKTEMVDALAYSCNRPYFELQGMDDLKLKDILFEWDEAGQNNFVVQAVARRFRLAWSAPQMNASSSETLLGLVMQRARRTVSASASSIVGACN